MHAFMNPMAQNEHTRQSGQEAQHKSGKNSVFYDPSIIQFAPRAHPQTIFDVMLSLSLSSSAHAFRHI